MNIDERIERRLGYGTTTGVIVDADALSPVSHLRSPVGRGPDLERLLDALDPAFTGSLPPSMYVHGPKGSGKSAVVTALFAQLAVHGGQRQSIQTSTRAVDPILPEFAYVDVRHARTRFQLYHDVLSAVSGDPVPDHGVSTDELAATLADTVESRTDIVVALDHTDEPASAPVSTVIEWLSSVSPRIVPVCLGREPPTAIDWEPEVSIEFGHYRHHVLVELLTSRVSSGLTQQAITHDQVREVSEWAAGDAHDALAAIMGAALHAERSDASTISTADLDIGIEGVPKPCVSLGRVLALSESRQRLLYELASLSESDRASVNAATESIAAAPAVDLSPATVRRILYELADAGLLDRVTAPRSTGKGRPPSRLVPRFPTLLFTELFGR